MVLASLEQGSVVALDFRHGRGSTVREYDVSVATEEHVCADLLAFFFPTSTQEEK